MRNGNGTGSVCKLSGNRRNKYRVYAPAKQVYNEERGEYVFVQKTIGYAKTKAEAYNMLYLYTNNPINNSVITYEELYNDFVKSVLINASQKTLNSYKYMDLFSRSLYNMNFVSINEKTLQELINNSDYSTRTLKIFKSIWHRIWDYAIFKKIVDINYADHIIVPNKATNRKATVFTEDEINILWDNSENDFVKMLLIYLYTGMRKNELFSVKLSDIYIDDRYLIGGLKTKAGINRVIPIHKRINPFVCSFIEQSKEFMLDNNKIKYTNLLYHLEKVIDKYHLNKHTIHDTRRTFITRLNDYGANITDIAKIVGHTTGIITIDVYTIKAREQLIRTIDLLP